MNPSHFPLKTRPLIGLPAGSANQKPGVLAENGWNSFLYLRQNVTTTLCFYSVPTHISSYMCKRLYSQYVTILRNSSILNPNYFWGYFTMDDISLLFDSNEWKKHDPNEEVNMEKFLRNLKHPGCEEVDRIG